MNYKIIGEDERFNILETLLQKHGLRKAEPVDLIIAGPRDSIINYLENLSLNALVWGGKESKKELSKYNLMKLTPSDFYQRKNSIATAEGTLSIAITESKNIIHDLSVLILGYGFLGKEVAELFQNVGSKVIVCSKDDDELSIANFNGISTINLSQLSYLKYPLIINTIPAKILTKDILNTTPEDCILIDLASVSCLDEADINRLKLIRALGLPGIYSPSYAAKCIYEDLLPFIGKEST